MVHGISTMPIIDVDLFEVFVYSESNFKSRQKNALFKVGIFTFARHFDLPCNKRATCIVSHDKTTRGNF